MAKQSDDIFVYCASYDSADDAWADYDTLLDAYHSGLVGTYDAVIFDKDDEGKVHIQSKAEKPTQHGAGVGALVGGVVGVLFPPSIIGTAIVGGVGGGLIEHFRHGLSRGEVKELAELLEPGQTGLLVVARVNIDEQIEQHLTRAQKKESQELTADGHEVDREVAAAEEQADAR